MGATVPGIALLLQDAVSDNRPGDLLTCVGRHLQHDHVTAVLGCGEDQVVELPRLPRRAHTGAADSVSTFVTRVPSVPAGLYWLGLRSSQPGFEASTRLPLRVVH